MSDSSAKLRPKNRRVLRWIKNAVVSHYSDTDYKRSEVELEREKWLIPKVLAFNRHMLTPCAILSQACVGSLYAWSGYNLAIEAQLYGRNEGVDRAKVVNVFYVAIAIFTFTTAILGPWQERKGPTKGLLLGSSMFLLGHLVTALGVYVKQLPLIYLGYGFFGGIGLGSSYIAPIAPLLKWFPERRGMAACVAVCGFGVGCIVSPFTQRALLGPDIHINGKANVGVELTFVILGSCYFVLMSICALILRMPPPDYRVYSTGIETLEGAEQTTAVVKVQKPQWSQRLFPSRFTSSSSLSPILSSAECSQDVTKRVQNVPEGIIDVVKPPAIDYSSHFSVNAVEALSSMQYWLIYVTFLGVEVSGTLIVSKIQSIVQNQLGRPSSDAAAVNSIFGALDLLGRLILPPLSDLIKARKPLFLLSLVCQAICLGCLPSALHAGSYAGVIACTSIISFFYGAGFALIPAFLADQFGARNVGTTQGVILTACAIVSIGGGWIFTAIYDLQKVRYPDEPVLWYDLNFRWILAPVLLSLVTCIITPTDLRDRRLPKVPKELVRFRFINGRLVRMIRWKLCVVSKAQEDKEWDVYLHSLEQVGSTTDAAAFNMGNQAALSQVGDSQSFRETLNRF